MTVIWSCRTTLHVGETAWESATADITRHERVFLVVDGGLTLAGRVATAAFPTAPTAGLDPRHTDIDAVATLAARFAQSKPDTVIAIGGGSVLDVVKLACLHYSDPRTIPLLRVRGNRAGLVTVPTAADAPQPHRVFVPTTLGTGAEASPAACVSLAGKKRLVIGTQLRPDVGVLDPRFTASLPHHLLTEGVLEALLRLVGPFVGSASDVAMADADTVALMTELVAVGDRLSAGDSSASLRLYAARLSAASHTGWALAGREQFAAKHWYLANELSTTLGVRKMAATTALLPAVWSRIAAGDERYGYRDRLTTAWRVLREATLLPLPEDPSSGLPELLGRWHLSHTLRAAPQQLVAAAKSAITAWGGSLPMLAGLSTRDVEQLYADAVVCPEISTCLA